MILKLLVFIGFLLVPSLSYAWGPLTHMYLGNEILSLSSLLPAPVYSLIKRYKDDFLYGNIIADIVLGKKYLPQDKSSHTWKFGFQLLDQAKNRQQKAFVYGYLCHLAADTVAHELLTREKKNIRHTFYELKADSLVKKKYWFQAIAIRRKVQRRNDMFLESSLDRLFFSFKTNKRIFKSFIFMTLFTPKSMSNLIDRSLFITSIPEKDDIKKLREESLIRSIDVLQKGIHSSVLQKSPSGELIYGKIVKTLLRKRETDA